MKEDRNQMFFPGGGPMGPMGQMFPGMNPGMAPGMGPGMAPGFGPGFQGGAMPNINQLENRISTLERQVKRLDARISRLETPFPGIGLHHKDSLSQVDQEHSKRLNLKINNLHLHTKHQCKLCNENKFNTCFFIYINNK